jgi:hypothetical protein
MSRCWALTVATDTPGAEPLLAAALAGVAGALVGALGDGFSEQATRKTLQTTSSKEGTIFMGDGVV